VGIAAAVATILVLMSTWSEILQWLQSRPSSALPQPWQLKLGLRREVEPPDEVPGVNSEEMGGALIRLEDHGLIAGRRQETIGYAYWSGLRVTASGMRVLGEWPDLDRLTTAVGLKLLIYELAEAAGDVNDQGALRRLVGVIGEVGEGVALNTLNGAAGALGDELSGE
jgi:hypothetical protein